ncbi:MAG: hypothetical protein Edafosvirus14_19 [Edafosvirus sp.]|uniref:Uncharacterized protein n=1 Tax=Edafosvirus sp. TaxID=2487765 RepID=A0A3G4ZU96_9VIRU|nr:MAG: hypothetical protein Edafosvirus14_19 [Edafosvirus sp.]
MYFEDFLKTQLSDNDYNIINNIVSDKPNIQLNDLLFDKIVTMIYSACQSKLNIVMVYYNSNTTHTHNTQKTINKIINYLLDNSNPDLTIAQLEILCELRIIDQKILQIFIDKKILPSTKSLEYLCENYTCEYIIDNHYYFAILSPYNIINLLSNNVYITDIAIKNIFKKGETKCIKMLLDKRKNYIITDDDFINGIKSQICDVNIFHEYGYEITNISILDEIDKLMDEYNNKIDNSKRRYTIFQFKKEINKLSKINFAIFGTFNKRIEEFCLKYNIPFDYKKYNVSMNNENLYFIIGSASSGTEEITNFIKTNKINPDTKCLEIACKKKDNVVIKHLLHKKYNIKPSQECLTSYVQNKCVNLNRTILNEMLKRFFE